MGVPVARRVISMTRILLVRHGHVEGIMPERFRGRRDVVLSEDGLRQARAVAQYIELNWHPSSVYTSPLQRCVQTGQEIAKLGGLPLEILEEFNDLDYGQWQWHTHEEIAIRSPKELQLWKKAPQNMRFPMGESLQDLAARVAEALRRVLKENVDKTVVLVGHDSSNRVLLLHVLDLPLSAYWRFAQHPCGLSEIEIAEQAVLVVRLNETQHLIADPP